MSCGRTRGCAGLDRRPTATRTGTGSSNIRRCQTRPHGPGLGGLRWNSYSTPTAATRKVRSRSARCKVMSSPQSASRRRLAALGPCQSGGQPRTRSRNAQGRFEEAFWCEEIGTYALALDGDKRPCRVRSVPIAGHVLFAGIARSGTRGCVARSSCWIATFFTGWGIRTMRVGSSVVQSDVLSQRLGLASRQCADRPRHRPVWLRPQVQRLRRVCTPRRATWTCAAHPNCSAASRAGRARDRRPIRSPVRRRRGRRRAARAVASLPRPRLRLPGRAGLLSATGAAGFYGSGHHSLADRCASQVDILLQRHASDVSVNVLRRVGNADVLVKQ